MFKCLKCFKCLTPKIVATVLCLNVLNKWVATVLIYSPVKPRVVACCTSPSFISAQSFSVMAGIASRSHIYLYAHIHTTVFSATCQHSNVKNILDIWTFKWFWMFWMFNHDEKQSVLSMYAPLSSSTRATPPRPAPKNEKRISLFERSSPRYVCPKPALVNQRRF